MKFRSAIMIVAMVTFGSLSTIVPPSVTPAHAAESKDATGLTSQQKIDLVTKNKGVFGNGDQLRRFFFGDLAPLGVQTGGAGMIVTLYNKANNVTFAYCADFDVVVAVKKGKVTTFPSAEVK
jgi:hypothetical protein